MKRINFGALECAGTFIIIAILTNNQVDRLLSCIVAAACLLGCVKKS